MKIFGLIFILVGLIFSFKVAGLIIAIVIILSAFLIDLSFSLFRKKLEAIPGKNTLDKIKNWFKLK